MATVDETHQALIDSIANLANAIAGDTSSYGHRAEAIRNLAEAYAWAVSPSQSHGGSLALKS
ncbi:MAG TPA: hypothetical protein VHC43_09850 [Mycobacteriales bacterium]|nr:hypothetical protein [Mycobacteriales bacterium]